MVLFAVCSEGGIEVAMREKGGRSLASWPWVEEYVVLLLIFLCRFEQPSTPTQPIANPPRPPRLTLFFIYSAYPRFIIHGKIDLILFTFPLTTFNTGGYRTVVLYTV